MKKTISLEIINGELAGERFVFSGRRRVYIGRSADCGICLAEYPTVSRYHCAINVSEDGAVLKDLDSSNGVYVNDALVSECVLEDRDVIGLGKSCMIQCVIGVEESPVSGEEDEAEIRRVMRAMETDAKTVKMAAGTNK